MKLSSRDAPAYFRKPDASKSGILIFGADAMRVSLRRQEIVAALVGPSGEDEMRLDRIDAGDLRKDAAALPDAMKARGFFPGMRVVLVTDATDSMTAAAAAALEDWGPDDARLVMTAGQLNARSSLRKLFEAAPNAYAVGIYDDPPSRAEIEAALKQAGLKDIDRDAMNDIQALAASLDPGDFRQTVERMALYKLSDMSPLSSEEVAKLAPASVEAGFDDVINVVAEARAQEIGPILSRLRDQGVTPVSLSISATRHFRTLHAAAADPGGPGAGIGKLRPPVFGPRRDRMVRQAQAWGTRRLESALALLIDADLTLRSASQAPDMAVMERTLIRLAMMRDR